MLISSRGEMMFVDCLVVILRLQQTARLRWGRYRWWEVRTCAGAVRTSPVRHVVLGATARCQRRPHHAVITDITGCLLYS